MTVNDPKLWKTGWENEVNWQELQEAVTDLALAGHQDAPAEALRRLCDGEWIAQGNWNWKAWFGAVFTTQRDELITADRWKGLRDGIARGLLPWDSGALLPMLGNEFIFGRDLPNQERVSWFWRHSRFETALLTGPNREEWFSAVDIYVCEPPPPFEPEEAQSPLTAEPTASISSKGGRPPIWDWEAAALVIAGRYFVDVWKPANVAEVVRALQDWASENGQDLPDATAKPHAKRIFEAIQRWENAP